MTEQDYREERVLRTDAELNPQTRDFIATEIRKRRRERGWTQGELAQKTNQGRYNIVSSWETRKKVPGLLSLYRLAEAFDCTIHDLLPPRE